MTSSALYIILILIQPKGLYYVIMLQSVCPSICSSVHLFASPLPYQDYTHITCFRQLTLRSTSHLQVECHIAFAPSCQKFTKSNYQKLCIFRYTGCVLCDETLKEDVGIRVVRPSNNNTQNNRQAPQNNRQPPQNNRQPPQNNRQSPQNNRQPPQNNRQPPQNNRQPPQNNRQPPKNNRQPPSNISQSPQTGLYIGRCNVTS